jgi:hypothetical protein
MPHALRSRHLNASITAGVAMAKPNYQFEKRQRDLAKKKQQDEKRLKKRAKNETRTDESGADANPAPTTESRPEQS